MRLVVVAAQRRRAAGRCAGAAPARSRRGPPSYRGAIGDQQVVEVVAPLRRPALHELQVVGREHRDPHELEQVACARCSGCRLSCTRLRPGGADLGLEQLRARAVDDLGAQDRRLAARAHERGVGDAPERRAGRRPADRLEQAGLALRVGPAMTVTPGGRRERRRSR